MTAAATTERARTPVRRRAWALVRLYDSRLRVRVGAQLGKLCAALLTIGFGIAIPFAARAPSGDNATSALVYALGWLSWLSAGAIALSACGPSRGDEDAALVGLSLSRGFQAADVAWARALATARRIGRVVGVPALILSVLALGVVRHRAMVLSRLALPLAALLYVAILAGSIALLVHLARVSSRDRVRTTFLLLIFVPHVVHGLLPQVPSLPWLLGRLLDGISLLGGPAR